MSATRLLVRDRPSRAIALATSTHVLVFRHSPSASAAGTVGTGWQGSGNASSTSLPGQVGGSTAEKSSSSSSGPRCIVELVSSEKADLTDYRTVSQSVHGTLGLITIDNDVFLCVVGGATKAATLRPGETVQRILSVDFHCLNRPDFDHVLNDDIGFYHSDMLDDDEQSQHPSRRDSPLEHPCLTLGKLLSGGSFYFSADFDLTSRLQDRSLDRASFDFDMFDKSYLWNSYMIKPLVDFRSRLSNEERTALDSTRLLTSAIRGFAMTMHVSAPSSAPRTTNANAPSTLTLVSRLSCRRAGTRFNARGIDDDGYVANFVESETVFWNPSGLCFSFAQIRGSVPLFWEQSAGLLPGQQKVQVTRSAQATQPAFDKHFDELEVKYGPIHIVNLLSREKPGEAEISERYRDHVARCSVNSRQDGADASEHKLVRETHYDFHAQTRVLGYEAASGIRPLIQDSVDSFGYCLVEAVEDLVGGDSGGRRNTVFLQQQGVFRTNCLDCLDRTNLMQTIISQMAIESFVSPRGEKISHDFLGRHGTLWADNGDALSKIYAGTGALKSSFTRSGKMSFAGALADARKSATRMYINNFADKGRQTTMDILLGRLVGQTPVYLFDPINDYVTAELNRRASEYTTSRQIRIWTGTFNLNGRSTGLNQDLSPWLCPPSVPAAQQNPEIVAVGFQEIVELSPQQIMSTEPTARLGWEKAVNRALNENARACGEEEYVLLRGGQLVGAALSIFVKTSLLGNIKNVEGSLKKTGMSGMAGNKGAVAIRLEIDNTSLCFVTAHLAAGFANFDERNRDYRTISHGLRFQRNRSIEDHDTVIWMGDFNYRIGLGDEKVRKLAKAGDFEKLYENDQLNLQMVAGLTFPYYSEARILFMPTYKYDLGSDEYDTSEKARIPAWTDRVLRKGNNLRQINYDTAPLRFSDHRPVYATFTCIISIVDEQLKGSLSKEIYAQRKATVGSSILGGGNNASDETDEEDLLGYESIGNGLPPASSDKRKWWLDNGQPARSNIQPPTPDSMPNPDRPSNPFTPSSQPDWITQKGANAPTLPRRPVPGSTPISSTDSASEQRPNARQQGVTSRNASYISTVSAASTASSVHSPIARKPAPPVPKKPGGLASPPRVASNASSSGKAEARAGTEMSAPVQPARSATLGGGPNKGVTAPGLPTRPTQLQQPKQQPQTQTQRSQVAGKSLLDDDDGEEGDDATRGGWAPLQPS